MYVCACQLARKEKQTSQGEATLANGPWPSLVSACVVSSWVIIFFRKKQFRICYSSNNISYTFPELEGKRKKKKKRKNRNASHIPFFFLLSPNSLFLIWPFQFHFLPFPQLFILQHCSTSPWLAEQKSC